MGGYQSISGNYIHIDKNGDSQVFHVWQLLNLSFQYKKIIGLKLEIDKEN